MKTIEERAKEWIDSLGAGLVHPYNRQAMIDAYIAGAKAQYEELTRWHDPKEELPEYIKVVEVKYKAFNKIMMYIMEISKDEFVSVINRLLSCHVGVCTCESGTVPAGTLYFRASEGSFHLHPEFCRFCCSYVLCHSGLC